MSEAIAIAGPVVFFTGAGMSVSAGLPTYRGAGGLYTNSDLEPPHASDIAIERLPRLWQRFRGRLEAGVELEPTSAHRTIAAFESSMEVAVVTQNVDGLHRRAGSSRVMELHGTLADVRCLDAGHISPVRGIEWGPDGVPLCPECEAWTRPAVVLFGETLPPDAWRDATRAMSTARTLVAVGTSAEVYPAAGLIASGVCPAETRLWINPETEPPSGDWTWLRGPADDMVARLVAG